jgi:ribonuclease HI
MDTCKHCGTELIVKQTKRTSEQLKKSYYYTAYYFCPACKKLYHDEKFKVVNTPAETLFTRDTRLPAEALAKAGDTSPTVHIWTDGASRNNGTENARAAWAFVSGKTEKAGRVIGKQTNNTAEAFAIYHALLWAAEEKHKKVKIYTDSQITLHGLAKSPDRVKENREIFQLIQDVISANGLTVDYEKVPAHADNVNNNRADRLANELAGIK